ncbi:hypothetical protein, partial [Herbaspirillum sp. C9C3]|uniref:hypothetical protein n=1 Tax=Herbaspirillum sp. C9C3 TaxID=2735271 RepID=UPI00184D24D4
MLPDLLELLVQPVLAVLLVASASLTTPVRPMQMMLALPVLPVPPVIPVSLTTPVRPMLVLPALPVLLVVSVSLTM